MKINIKKHLTLIALLLIFLIGALLRFYNLQKFPVGFHLDEAINGVNANFILHTGRDSNDIAFPLQTEMFGDYNPIGYVYLAILPIKFFGLTEFATRFPGALLGSLTILAIFLLTYAIFSNKKLALLASFLVGISPWHIILSRSSEQTLVSLFFIVLGFSLMTFSLSRKNRLTFLISGTIILSISYFMYFTPRVFVPIMLLIFIACFLKQLKQNDQRYKLSFIGCLLVLVSLSFYTLIFMKGGKDRFNQLSIFNFPETKLVMEEQIREDGVIGKSIVETRIFHNKIINYSLTYLSNYFSYFTVDFMFLKGGLPSWLNTSGLGYIYIVELPFFCWGIVELLRNKGKKNYFLILWLLLSPLVAAVTVDETPNIRRSLIMFPTIEIISAYGFLSFIENRKNILKKIWIFIVGAALVFNFAYFVHQYFGHGKIHRTWYRDNGASLLMNEVGKVYNNYDKIIVSKFRTTYPLILFYMKYDPNTYLLEGHSKDKDYSGFGKFFFVPQGCPAAEKSIHFPHGGHSLYINSPDCKDVKDIDYSDIFREDGTKAFRLAYD